ncbi:MAG: RraA family protein [Myxococcales bacterium]|nr:MAG: RraA family protein [Myxococcales bacterium]
MTATLQEQIVRQIRLNRISTTEIADCMDKTGLYAQARPLNRSHFRAGPVFWVYAYNESNWELHEQLRAVPEGSIVIVDAKDCRERAIFGSLVTKYLMLYRRCEAIVTNGLMRDVPHLLKENWPIWCAGATPIGCFNRKNERPVDPAWEAERRAAFDGALAVCDDSGVVVIPKAMQNEAFLDKLAFIEEQEDIWFFCLDTLKWDTYRTVCMKDYLGDEKLARLLNYAKEHGE